ncbi:MAG: hypothetical protein Q9214_004191 [Letrouitia sp. 1 TL-2023]
MDLIPMPGRSAGVTKDNGRHETKLRGNARVSKRSTDTVSKSQESNSTKKRAPRQEDHNALLLAQVRCEGMESRLTANNFTLAILQNSLKQLEPKLHKTEKEIQSLATLLDITLPTSPATKGLKEKLYDTEQWVKNLAVHVGHISSAEVEKKSRIMLTTTLTPSAPMSAKKENIKRLRTKYRLPKDLYLDKEEEVRGQQDTIKEQETELKNLNSVRQQYIDRIARESTQREQALQKAKRWEDFIYENSIQQYQTSGEPTRQSG